MKFQTTDPVALVNEIDRMLKLGNTVQRVGWRMRWITWRYVRVYHVEFTFTRPQVATLKLEFGPVSERDLPLLSEGDCYVSID